MSLPDMVHELYYTWEGYTCYDPSTWLLSSAWASFHHSHVVAYLYHLACDLCCLAWALSISHETHTWTCVGSLIYVLTGRWGLLEIYPLDMERMDYFNIVDIFIHILYIFLLFWVRRGGFLSVFYCEERKTPSFEPWYWLSIVLSHGIGHPLYYTHDIGDLSYYIS